MMRSGRLFDSFGMKLMASYILLIMTPVIILGSFAYSSSVDYAREQARQNIQGTLKQMKDNVRFRMNDINRLSNQVYNDQTLQVNFTRRVEGWNRYEVLIDHVKPSLQKALDQTSLTVNMQIYLFNDTFPEYFFLHDEKLNPLNAVKRYELYHVSRLEQQAWHSAWERQSAGRANFEEAWKQVETDRQFGNISLIRDLYYFAKNERLGTLKITAKTQDIFQSINHISLGDDAGVFVYDGEQTPLYFSGGEEWNQRLAASASWQSDFLKIEERVEDTNWRIIAYIPNKLMEKNADKVRSITILVCCASFVLLVLVSAFISQSFSKRVKKIVYSLNAFREGEFMKRIAFKGTDEFAQMAQAFNEMAININELISEVYIANLRKQEAELSSLQSQINPHFLYNTLSSISRLAKFGEVDKLHEMVMGLAKFYRITLSDGNTIITVDRELQQVQSYIDIQKIKYAEGLEVACEIEPDILPYSTVKLILQPFVENALEHAWKADHIMIHITGYKEKDKIVFTISDDGIGMSQETIQQLFSKDGPKLGYGIRNVDDRIKLQFGDQYGVHISSVLNEGTIIRIEIPCYQQTSIRSSRNEPDS